MRRLPSCRKMMPTIVTRKTNTSTTMPPTVARSPLWASWMVDPRALGRVATMLMKITREAPWPMPRSVITSLTHITTIEPVTRARLVWTTNSQSGRPGRAYWRRISAKTTLCRMPQPRAT